MGLSKGLGLEGTSGVFLVEHSKDTHDLLRLSNATLGHCKDTLPLGTAGILCGWAVLPGYCADISAVGHCLDTRQGFYAVGHCRDTPWFGMMPLGTVALRGYSAVGYCWDTLRIFFGWALRRNSAVGHCAEGEQNIDFVKSNNPSVREKIT